MTDPTSGIHKIEKRRKGMPIDRLAQAAENVGGVLRADLTPGDRVIVIDDLGYKGAVIFKLAVRHCGTCQFHVNAAAIFLSGIAYKTAVG